jgi:hypothetical protein
LRKKSADTLRITWRDAIPDVDPYHNSQRTGMSICLGSTSGRLRGIAVPRMPPEQKDRVQRHSPAVSSATVQT